MLKSLAAAAALAILVGLPGPALADPVADRNGAIALCRTEIAARAGVDAGTIRLDQARLRGRLVRVDLDVWSNGRLQNIRCDVARGGPALTIASITPAVQTAAR
jgi:hypothetical protein